MNGADEDKGTIFVTQMMGNQYSLPSQLHLS